MNILVTYIVTISSNDNDKDDTRIGNVVMLKRTNYVLVTTVKKICQNYNPIVLKTMKMYLQRIFCIKYDGSL